MSAAESITGTVNWFDAKKGYGFITPTAEGEQIFVNYRDIAGKGFRSLSAGQRVEFHVEQNEKGPRAKNVRLSFRAAKEAILA